MKNQKSDNIKPELDPLYFIRVGPRGHSWDKMKLMIFERKMLRKIVNPNRRVKKATEHDQIGNGTLFNKPIIVNILN